MGPQGSITPIAGAPDPIDPNVRIGHNHLRTAYIDRIRDFYVGILGFDAIAEARDVPGCGTTGEGHAAAQFGPDLDLEDLLKELD